MFIERMKGQDYIDKTREYLDYLEEHLINVAKAFQEVSEACDGMAWVGDDKTWHELRHEILHHDISKFSKEEFTQYRDKFYEVKPIHDYSEIEFNFDNAWENHKEKNNHHWESILKGFDSDKYIGTAESNIVHVIVDWTAMSYKFGGTAQEYYEKNIHDINIDKKFKPFMVQIFNRLKK